MPVTKDEGELEVSKFKLAYLGISHLNFHECVTVGDLHGNPVPECLVGFKGGFIAPTREAHLASSSHKNLSDLREALLHEAIDHYGSLTFTENQKRNLLNATAEAREHLSLKAELAIY